MPSVKTNGPHYVYELRRTSEGAGPTRYIGVRTAPEVDPYTDEYWSSSERIRKERDSGVTFSKEVLATFNDREDAELFEAELHWQNMVGKNPHFYNVTAQLIEGKVDLLFPRERYISPYGEHLWFKEGGQPIGWRHDPAKWAQFRAPDNSDPMNQLAGFPQTYLGLELPEWEFHKFYPAELAFAASQPRHCHEPYVKLDYRNDILDCYYFPIGGQPNGWVRGLAPNSQIRSNVPDGWGAYFHIFPLKATSAYFPRGQTPRGWVDAETLSDMHKGRLTKGLKSNTIEAELHHIFLIAGDEFDARDRLREFRSHRATRLASSYFSSPIAETILSQEQQSLSKKVIGKDVLSFSLHCAFDVEKDVEFDSTRNNIIRNNVFDIFDRNANSLSPEEWINKFEELDLSDADKILSDQIIKEKIKIWSFSEKVPPLSSLGDGSERLAATTPNLADDPLEEHIGAMLSLAARLHKAAMSQLDKPKADPMPQLLKAQKLLEEAEVLASDAASYVDADELDSALAELYRQQGEVRAMIGQVEASRVRPPQANTIPLIFIALFAAAALCVWVSI